MATGETERGSSDGLPEDMIPEILARLPPKHLLRSRAACKAWRDLATDPAFIRRHHSFQPRQALVFTYGVGGCLQAVDLATNKRRTVLRVIQRVPPPRPFADGALMVHGSCDGLLLLSFHRSFFVCNPATRQGARLPLLLQDGRDVLGFYQHAASGEYRVLYHEAGGLGLQMSHTYYVLTVGSPQARSIDLRTSSAEVGAGLMGGLERSCTSPPVLLHGSLHWSPQLSQGGHILVFDQAAESFRRISPPAQAMLTKDDHTQLFEMEGKLAMFCSPQFAKNLAVWFMDDYKEMRWVWKYWVKLSFKLAYQPIPLPPCPIVLYQEGDMLVPEEVSDKVLHCDKTGKSLGPVDCSAGGTRVTPHMLKESLVLHDFLQTQRNDGACEWFSEVEFADGSDTAIAGDETQTD
ncbi:hypothetical protein CFC21_051574 [Triticum aestivum]|uniref:F-box domain-containing protein n=2 Tax=Triticum aestivum TaxID=4565 RepID=A0A9R1G7W2_WHEAT|nr:F-box/LRR-repeat protein At2g43260-like [Triticum aestivum]KAF7041839.1 hypothetical protein CFC21_051574 [Triticum aestivum]